MKRLALIIVVSAVALAGCGGGGSGAAAGTVAGSCSLDEQKQFVLDQMRDIYFWNASLPQAVDLGDFATPEDLLAFLTSFEPLDSFSFINSAAADAQFFGEGQFAGFGFGYQYGQDDSARLRFVYAGSPAADAGFERGQQILAIDEQTVASLGPSGLADAFGPSEIDVTRRFSMRRIDGTEYDVDVTKEVVTIDPVPQARLIDTASGQVGYLELSTFISTAEGEFSAAFEEFAAAGVTDLVLDLRYNGGGLVSIAELLGDYLVGASANGLVFSKTIFNSNNTARNSTDSFRRLLSSLALSRLVVIATGHTASASELIINGLEPHAEVVIVAADTFGKPVGQVGIEFCEKILRPTAFEKVNALDQGGFFDGLPVDCPAADDLETPIGDAADPALQTSLAYLANGACPAVATLDGAGQAAVGLQLPDNYARNAWESIAGAY